MKEKGKKTNDSFVIDKTDQEKNILLTYFESSEEIILEITEKNCTETWNYLFDKEYILVYSKYKDQNLIVRKYITFVDMNELKKSDKSIVNSFSNYINKYLFEGSN